MMNSIPYCTSTAVGVPLLLTFSSTVPVLCNNYHGGTVKCRTSPMHSEKTPKKFLITSLPKFED